jgi:hypothetical protein
VLAAHADTGPVPRRGRGVRHRVHERLDRFGPAKLARTLERIAREHQADRLVLLCHEVNWWQCHRQMVADWMLATAGEVVTEIDGTAPQSSGPDGWLHTRYPALDAERDCAHMNGPTYPTTAPGNGPWRVLILDRGDDPKWLVASVSGPSEVRAAGIDSAARYTDWAAVTAWVASMFPGKVELQPLHPRWSGSSTSGGRDDR